MQYLTEIIETKSIPEKIYGTSGMVHFALQIKIRPLHPLNVAAYWKGSNTEACA